MKYVSDLWRGVKKFYQLVQEIKLFYKEINVVVRTLYKNYQSMDNKYVG
jgi:hypothetical protein